MTAQHDLKTDPYVFDASACGIKPWEIRFNDRDFQVGDRVRLLRTRYSGADMANGAPLEYTGEERVGRIAYLMDGPEYGLPEGWCIFTVQPENEPAIEKIATERLRQMGGEGWSTAHDDQHVNSELAVAGAVYALHAAACIQKHPDALEWPEGQAPGPWPFEPSWFKSKSPHRDLVRAGALIAAEIERLDRERLRELMG